MTSNKNRGWSVTMAGLGINLALGILYTWSIFKLAIKESILAGDGHFNWALASLNDPYAVCCLVFAFSMVFAGRLQDSLGPRLTAMIGGILTGLGLIWISQSNSLFSWVLGFGVLTGAGLGFAYASATPPALKWFPASKTGLIAGLVVSGFGLASVYIAPLATHLIGNYGLSTAMLIFGGGFMVVVCLLAQFLINPPLGFKPVESTQTSQKAPVKSINLMPMEMLKNRNFYLLWSIFAVASGAGLMIIGNVAGMAKASMGEYAWLLVALMAVGNAAGRIVAGTVSDKIGRTQTLALVLCFQALIMFSLTMVGKQQMVVLIMAACLIGFNYGTNLSLFPSACKDYFGLKNFGANYGILFSAWGVGGFILPRISQMIVAHTGSFDIAYVAAGVLLVLCAGMTLVVQRPRTAELSQAEVERLAQATAAAYNRNRHVFESSTTSYRTRSN